MDFRASLDQLEAAASLLLAAPNVVSKEERTSAENMIMTFRKTRNAFGLCKFILENSQTELVIFETADVLRNNLIQDWNKLPQEDVHGLSQHILNILMSHTSFSFSIKRRLAGVIALIVKHQSLANGGSGKNRLELVNHVVTTAINASGDYLVLACCLLDALLSEHQYVVNADDASLKYEMHFVAKKDFENSDLLKIFQFCLQFLTAYQHAPQKQRDLDNVLRVLESILCWNFTKINMPKRIAGVIEMEATPIFKPPPSWLETLNDSAFIPIFFQIHVKVRHDFNFVLRTVNLLSQLACMHRPVPQNKETRVDYLTKILPPLTALLNMPDKLGMEIYGLSDLIRKILLFSRASLLCLVPGQILTDFFKAVGEFSCQVIHQSAIEESKCGVDDRLYRESLTRLLEAWMNILTDTQNFSKDLVRPIVTDIFNCFLKAHISPPEGFRSPVASDDGFEEDQESDTNQFRDQLQAIGVFGRFILPHSVPIITQLLLFKCEVLQKQIQAVAQQTQPRETLEPIFEDLHWTLLIAGHLLAYDGLGETNLMPSEVVDFSIAAQCNPDLSASAFEKAFQIIPVEEGVDPVVRLVCCVIMLSEMERRVNSSGLGHLLSPELASNVLWFLHRFCESYFVVSEEYYTAVSPCFMAAWGPASPLPKIVQSSFLSRVKDDLVRYTGEVTVMRDAINLLLSAVDSNKKAELAIQSQELPAIVEIANSVGPGKYQMPNETYRKLIRSVIAVGSFCEDPDRREHYWNEVLGPLSTRFQNLSTVAAADKHRDDVRMEMACVLSGFIGAAMSSQSKTATLLYKRIGPVVSQCGAILHTYHNYIDIVELCIELVIELAKRSLSYLSPADSVNLYTSAMAVVKSYALHARGRISSEKSAEEDTYNDLVTLMDMLTCLLSKDFLDLSPESMSGNNTTPPVSACDVSILGLSTVLPLMNADLLQFPNLSSKYFRLIAFLSELHSDKILGLPADMLQAIYHSVQIGIQNGPSEAFQSCCEFIACIASYISKNSQQAQQTSEYCKPFLKIFLEMILSQRIGKDNVPSVSAVLFALISAFSDGYSELVNQLICSRTNEEVRATLGEAFSKLTEGLNMQNGGDRMSRSAFRDRLETFIFEAKGCLDDLDLYGIQALEGALLSVLKI